MRANACICDARSYYRVTRPGLLRVVADDDPAVGESVWSEGGSENDGSESRPRGADKQ